MTKSKRRLRVNSLGSPEFILLREAQVGDVVFISIYPKLEKGSDKNLKRYFLFSRQMDVILSAFASG